MQTIRVVLTAILLGLFGLAGPFVNCSAQAGESLYIRTEHQLYRVVNRASRDLEGVLRTAARLICTSRLEKSGAAL